jgi:hypothetical protein
LTKRRPLRASLTLIGLGLLSIGSARATTISFVEDPAEVAPIKVTTDIAGATVSSTLGTASVSIGVVTGTGALVLDIALIQPGTTDKTGGGEEVSDILRLLSFESGGKVVGFEAIYLSNEGEIGLPNPGFPMNPTFCSTTPGPGNRPKCGPNQPNSEFVKTGAPIAFLESVTLPGAAGPAELTVNVQSPLQDVPEPSALALFAAGLIAFGTLSQRKRRSP